jgi:hypothetical protein
MPFTELEAAARLAIAVLGGTTEAAALALALIV